MKNYLKTYFYFSRSERVGIYCLLFLCVLIILFPKFYPLLLTEKEYDFSSFQNEAEAFYRPPALIKANVPSKQLDDLALFDFDPNRADKESLLKLGLSEKVVKTLMNYRSKGGLFKSKTDLRKVYGLTQSDYERLAPFIRFQKKQTGQKKRTKESNEGTSKKESFQRFNFDPNTIGIEGLEDLGLKQQVAKTVINYRAKGGTFRCSSDLLKIYGLDTATYEQLKPFIRIDSIHNTLVNTLNKKKARPRKKVVVDINASSREEWQALYGIGPFYSEKIVEYRSALGGFYSINQLKEIYVLPDSTFSNIQENLIVSPIEPTLNINHLTAAELCLHPYINVKQAKVIANYRRNHGHYSSVEDLKKTIVLKTEEIERLAPYLSFE